MYKLIVGEYQSLIGERIKQYRINAGVSQKDLENEGRNNSSGFGINLKKYEKDFKCLYRHDSKSFCLHINPYFNGITIC